jgi:hypothetical protein
MIRRLVIRPEAEAEMTEAFDWYEERLPGLGASFLLCFVLMRFSAASSVIRSVGLVSIAKRDVL